MSQYPGIVTSELESRVYGCWLGKSIGGTLGLPAEGKTARLNFTFYDPIPTIAPPNDDLELQLVWLHLVEQSGAELTGADFAKGWLDHIHYMWDEYGRCRWNLRRGVSPEAAGRFENWFHAGMGSPIRSEIWACLFPGDPASAAYYAALDATLDHGVEGITGEVLFAVMQNLVLSGVDVGSAIVVALGRIPKETETARAVQLILDDQAEGVEAWASREHLLAAHGNSNFTHAPLNVALTIWALVHGGGDFEASILLAANGGYDTDCTAATVGATLGLAIGASSIPPRWIEPIGEGVYIGPGIQEINAAATLGELTARTLKLVGKLDRKTWDDVPWPGQIHYPSLESLPGTIYLRPLDGTDPVPWANCELPASVLRAGGAEWDWEVPEPAQTRRLIVLARAGARLVMDGEEVFTCPPGLPFMPATHRCPPASVLKLTPTPGRHRLRLELAVQDTEQEAAVLLCYPNRQLAPWTAAELPHPANLPA